jgi:hypothetical protein
MQRLSPTRILHLAGALSLCMPLAAQSPTVKPSAAIPATQPTAMPPGPPAPSLPAQHRAEVTFNNGMLTVKADNSSLNQILYDIARQTGMKINGGVVDERVFGHYGPSRPGVILGTLLDGTGSNMLLVSTQGHDPTELILTPRHGGPTPPDPNAVFAQQHDQEDQERQEREHQETAHPVPPQQPLAQNPATPSGATDPATSNTTDQQSPNGVKTPQQIFDQLQKLRQQQTTAAPQ